MTWRWGRLVREVRVSCGVILSVTERVWARVRKGLTGELDPEQTAVYEENEKAYVSLLEELDDEFREVVSSAKRDVLLFGDRFSFSS